MTGNQGSQRWAQPQPLGPVGAVSPDGRYVFTGVEWVLRQPEAAARKSRTALWVGMGIAVTAVVAAAAGALVMSPGFQEGFRAGYAATAGWTASDLEDSIRSSFTLIDSGSELGVQAVDCVGTDTADWFVCSWRHQGDPTSFVYTVETSGTRWQSSNAILMGSVSDLSQSDINSLVSGTGAVDGWTPQPTNWDPTADGYKDCGGGVYGNEVTSCPFARNVADAYNGSGGSPVLPDVPSPVTGLTYTMTCTDSDQWAVCQGGNDAEVLVRTAG